MFAIDGCKIRSNASKEWSGTFEELERKQAKLRRASQRILERHQSQDNLGEDEVAHKNRHKGKPVKSNITDPDSAKMTGTYTK